MPATPARAVLRGPRLLLRPHRPPDAVAIFEATERSRREVRVWMPWEAWSKTLGDTRDYIRHVARARREGTSFDFVVVEHATGEVVGCAGLNEVRRDRVASRAHVGYWIRTDRTGRGYATEATVLLITFAFGSLGLARVEIRVAPGNRRSRRIPEKLGVRYEGTSRASERVRGRFLDHRVYALTLPDFRKLWPRWKRWLRG